MNRQHLNDTADGVTRRTFLETGVAGSAALLGGGLTTLFPTGADAANTSWVEKSIPQLQKLMVGMTRKVRHRDCRGWIGMRAAIPAKYHPLLDWYERDYAPQRGLKPEADPLLALRGSGRELWADEHADQYVRRLREG